MWGEHYDRPDGDPFAVQDEIAANIVGCIEPMYLKREELLASRRNARDVQHWDLPLPPVRCLSREQAAVYLGIGVTLLAQLDVPTSSWGVVWSTTALTSIPGWTTIRASEGGPERRMFHGP